VEIGLGCAVSKEDGAGIVDVNSGTGELNEPLIPSSVKKGENACNGWGESDELIEVNAI